MACEESLNYCLLALVSTFISVVGALITIVKAKQVDRMHKELQEK